jgi:CHAT domain-containing protein
VELVQYTPFHPQAQKPQQEWSGTPRYVAYVLRQKDEPAWVDLGEAAPIDQAVAKLRAALSNPNRTDVQRLARALDEKVMRPVRPLLGNARLILLSPDGALNLVPFGALVDEENRYLIERFTFVYLTTGRDLLRLQVLSQERQGPVVIANPDFDDGDAPPLMQVAATTNSAESRRSADFTTLRFGPLPGTAGEALGLQDLLSKSQMLTGAAATEAALKQVHGPRILHIATHGFFLANQPQQPEATRGVTVVHDDSSLRPSSLWVENPLLRSGLALSGANLRQSRNEDGVLTALEAAGLDLWGTKLVVLSACETGVGAVQNGEGVYGLRRALVMAGAESQVMSLWKVADEATRDLMVAYYKRLLSGEGRAEALRQVQLTMLASADRSHPFYWASFIPSGQWAPIGGQEAARR